MKASASALALLLTFAAAPTTSAGEIYRCEIDGVTTFSDAPCGPDARLHDTLGRISLIKPDSNLPALAEANQAFIEARRERAAESRRQRAIRSTPPQPTIEAPALVVPWPVIPVQREVHRQRPQEPPGQQRYSALNGPILGTRDRDENLRDQRRRDDTRWEDPEDDG